MITWSITKIALLLRKVDASVAIKHQSILYNFVLRLLSFHFLQLELRRRVGTPQQQTRIGAKWILQLFIKVQARRSNRVDTD
jgi:hypothetical protein